MMNYIAILIIHYLVNNPLRDRTTLSTATPSILPTAVLWNAGDNDPRWLGTNFSAGIVIALAAAAAIWFLLNRTAMGFEIRAVGAGPDAARASGISVGRTMVSAMAVSGALAGLAGAIEVLGVHRRFFDQFSPGYGFDSIAVALLGGLTSGGVTLSALLFGSLEVGAKQMELGDQQTPHQIAGIIQAVVILAVGVRYLRQRSGSK
jgi:general nucleoside transport system permease protein